jgi:Amt family ammonium transporter
MALEKRWISAFIIITIVAFTGLFWQHQSAGTNFNTADTINTSDVAWLLTASCLVLLMTPGLSFFYGGMVGKKNVISTMLKSFICLGVVSLLWVTVGFSLSFGNPLGITINHTHYGIIGNPLDFAFFDQVEMQPHKAMAPTIPFILFALFQMKFAVITPAIITGALAERIRFISFLLFICLFTLCIYTPLCHMIWHPHGLLGSYLGVKDFAGGTVVHMSAGFAALAGVIVLGKRKNNEHIPTNIPFVLLGTGLLWFGWFGFNAGSALAANATAAMAFATTTIASASAMMTWVFFDRLNGRKVSALGACIGAVVGLVVITPSAGYITIPQSIFFGFIGAIVSNKIRCICLSRCRRNYGYDFNSYLCSRRKCKLTSWRLACVWSSHDGVSIGFYIYIWRRISTIQSNQLRHSTSRNRRVGRFRIGHVATRREVLTKTNTLNNFNNNPIFLYFYKNLRS